MSRSETRSISENMSQLHIISVSFLVVLITSFVYLKLSPNIPDPSEGVQYYYQCKDFEDRRLLSSGSLAEPSSMPIPTGQTLFVLIPGYTESSFRNWVKVVSKALLEARPSSCVLFVDHWNYVTFSRPFMTLNVKTIAQSVADLFLTLQTKSSLRLSDVHVIGFSLGGWVAGLISNFLPDKRIGRITGIDSSFPWVETNNTEEFLDSGDAEVVVLIRTSTVSVKVPPVDIDFFVNGGEVQPECDVWWHPNVVRQICSHYKAPFLFVSHLLEESSSFSACGCPDRASLLRGSCPCHLKNSFGLNTQAKLKGKFYLETSTQDRK